MDTDDLSERYTAGDTRQQNPDDRLENPGARGIGTHSGPVETRTEFAGVLGQMIGRGFVYEQADLPKREDEHSNKPETSQLAQWIGSHSEMIIYEGFEGNHSNRLRDKQIGRIRKLAICDEGLSGQGRRTIVADALQKPGSRSAWGRDFNRSTQGKENGGIQPLSRCAAACLCVYPINCDWHPRGSRQTIDRAKSRAWLAKAGNVGGESPSDNQDASHDHLGDSGSVHPGNSCVRLG